MSYTYDNINLNGISKVLMGIIALLVLSSFLSNISTVTPTPTPINYGDNYAEIPIDWGFFDTYGYYVHDGMNYTFIRDTINTYNGHETIKSIGLQNDRELDYSGQGNYSISVSPNDRVIYKAWIKTSDSNLGHNGNNKYGGIIGFDLYYNNNRIWEYAHGTTTNFIVTNPIMTYYNDYIWVSFGSDWTQLIIDMYIPITLFSTDDYGHDLGYTCQINKIIPWLYATSDINESGEVWFANTEIYIIKN